jgi:hypothetical protein
MKTAEDKCVLVDGLTAGGFELDYEIASHCDYWDFIGAVVDHRQYVALPVTREVAVMSSVFGRSPLVDGFRRKERRASARGQGNRRRRRRG